MKQDNWQYILAAGVFLCCLFPPCSSAQEYTPKTERQIVFGVSPYDGTQYLSTFLPEAQENILLTANTDNVITVLLSDVYYWPITAEYRADFQGVHIPLAGKLSVFRDNDLIRELERTEYIYVYPQGPAGEATRLLYGAEMDRFIIEIENSRDERAVNPNRLWASFQGPFQGFVVNLPPGNYRLVFSVENEGQEFLIEKRLRVFTPLGHGTVYQIIPDEKWTVSSNSETPQQRIYLKPGSIIYLKIFPTILYSRADYERMASPHRPSAGTGLENTSIWIHEEASLEDDGVTALRIDANSQSVLINPKEFLVRQLEGSSLGYAIIDYDPEKFPDTRPTFTAYRLSAPPPGIGVRFSISGRGDEAIRYLHTLEPRVLYAPLLALLLPFILLGFRLMLGVLESRRYKCNSA
jgi:hypothetical protein